VLDGNQQAGDELGHEKTPWLGRCRLERHAWSLRGLDERTAGRSKQGLPVDAGLSVCGRQRGIIVAARISYRSVQDVPETFGTLSGCRQRG
jgi:hypothetical protein